MDVSVATVTFEPGQTTASFSRAIYEDSIYEGSEIYGFEITSATNAQVNAGGRHTVLGYIQDNDRPVLPTVKFAAQDIDVSEGAGSVSVSLTLSEASDQVITVQVTPRSYRAGDMDVSVATVTFQPGQTTASFSRTIYEDSVYEGDEIYGFEITSAKNAQINMDVSQTILGYIRDNDKPVFTQIKSLTTGADTFVATSNDNWNVDGLAGNDSITTLNGADVVRGNAGNDTISTGAGDDVITFSGSKDGVDAVDGGEGTDRVHALADNTIVGLRSINNVEVISANGFTGVSIAGSTGADTLNFAATMLVGIVKVDGGTGSDNITGSAAEDTILGGDGNDTLNGGAGNDWLDGGKQNDVLTGGAGMDSFFFDNAKTSGFDRITDFGTGDRLLLSRALRDGNGDGIITFGTDGIIRLDGSSSGDRLKLDGVDPTVGLRFAGMENGYYVYALNDGGVSTPLHG